MNRSQKKSVAASTGLHLSLFLLILLVGPAFHSARSKPPELPPIDFIPLMTTDTDPQGGGTRGAHPPAAQPEIKPAPAVEAPAPVPPTPKPAPAVVKPPTPKPTPEPEEPIKKPVREVIPEAVKDPVPEPVKPSSLKPNLNSLEPTPRPPKRKPMIDPQITHRENSTELDQQHQRLEAIKKRRDWERQQQMEEDEQREVARRAQIAAAQRRSLALGLLHDVNHFSQGMPSSGSAVHLELEGPGGGGVPYANFLLGVQQVYQRDWQPRIPRGVTDTELAAMATVTIGRDGSVLEAKLTHSSGNREVDESVNASLNNVRQVVPLPEKAKESQRTITIEFNVKPKRSIG